MKKSAYFLLLMLFIAGCKTTPEIVETNVIHPEWTKDAIIYEVNVRQFTPEGTFAALENHLDRLDSLGIDILWLMPVHPIGVEGRKGTLGSYYSVKDYYDINPEYGTLDDFKHFLEAAHNRGFKVILDWVANHTARDCSWTTEHADWYYKDSKGKPATLYDWTDTAHLNYDNEEVAPAMIEAMKYWLGLGVDGFRCDVAAEVPVSFWDRCRTELQDVKDDVFMLAEAEKAELQMNAFDAYYTWDQMNQWYALAEGKINADSLANFYVSYQKKSKMPDNTIPMNFLSNHDQNSWKGADAQIYGDALKQFAVLSFTVPGMPMIYSGEEASLDHSLEFFEKDTIDWNADVENMSDFYKSLIAMRDKHCSLWAAPYGVTMAILPSDHPEEIFVFEREIEGDICLAMFNFSDEEVAFTVENHVVTSDSDFVLSPHGYSLIFSVGDCFSSEEDDIDSTSADEEVEVVGVEEEVTVTK